MEEWTERLDALGQLCRDNARRLDAVERQSAAIQSLATSVAVMAEKLSVTAAQVRILSADVRELRAEPGNRWRQLTEKLLYLITAAVVGYLTAGLGK